ncbi:CHASE2 domain-containing protein [Haloferula sp.]|uniref:CHASE2 domain-containing protein n=1 Tax=Haloferula sp. TaxID=2497595 RepID=UPI00329F0DDA
MPSQNIKNQTIKNPVGLIRSTVGRTRMLAAVVGAILTILVGQAALLRMGKSLVTMSYDIPFVLRGIFQESNSQDDIRIVYLSEAEDDRLDRRSQAKVLDKLGEAGARVVAYDIIFDQELDDPSIDQEFAEAILRFRGVDADWNPIPGMPQRQVILACGRKTINFSGIAGEQLIPPTDALMGAADDFGVVFFDDDSYFIRKVSTGTLDEPSLTWKTAKAAGAELNEEQRMETRWMNFAGPPPDPSNQESIIPIPSFPAKSLLEDDDLSGLYKDKIVIIGGEPGVVGAELGDDLFNTPYHRFPIKGKPPLMSGVEVQANGLANLINGNWITRSSHRFDTVLTVLAGLIIGGILTFLRPLRAVEASLALAIAATGVGVASHASLFWFPWTVVAFAQVPTAFIWGIASHYYIERFFRMKLTAEQEAIRKAFAKYLSPQMLDRLTDEGFTTNLGGEKIQASMMFTDLEGFTDMSERLGDPERIVEALNDYFERTTGHIFDHDGVIISFIGDAIYAAWGAPLADPEAPIKSVRAAWNLNQNDKLVVEGREIRTRIGLHTGEVVAGNLGSSRRIDYTLIGDAVNLAARLEGINKLFGTSILLSGSIHEHINGEFVTRRVGKFAVKGRKEAVSVYELLGPSDEIDEPEWVSAYHQALELLDRNDVDEALKQFGEVDSKRGEDGDGASRYFVELLKARAPVQNGVVVLKEK